MSNPHLTMKASVLASVGRPDNLEYKDSQPIPKITPGWVLVRNTFAGINYADTYFRTGYYPTTTGFPTIIGQEGVGVITAVGSSGPEIHNFKVGDRVVWIFSGAYAEYSAVPAQQCIKIPDGVRDEDAVGAFLMGMTALSLVQEAFPVRKGQTVLVHAAAGGVGLLMCQILREKGAVVIGTAGGKEKCDLAKSNGATHVIDYKSTEGPSWVEQVKTLTGGVGPDVVYDTVGLDTYEGSLDCVRAKGKVVFIGVASGPIPPINVERLAGGGRNITIMKPTLRGYIGTRKELEYWANGVLALVKDGQLKINVHKIYELRDVAQAHRDLEGRRTTGKLLVKL